MLRFLFVIFCLLNFKLSVGHEINKNKLNSIIKEFILSNPSILQQSLTNLEEKKNNQIFLDSLAMLNKLNNPNLSASKNDITIYEFFDYNCGYCKSVADDLIETFKEDKKVSIVFIEFPILSESSFEAAIAALAAHKQDKYLDFHLSLMNKRGRINKEVMLDVARKLKLDLLKFEKDLSDRQILEVIEQNRKVAQKLKIRGTPAFIIGNTIYPGALQKRDLKKAIKLERDKTK